MTDLERLLELKRFLSDGLCNSEGIIKHTQEYQSLKSKLEQDLEKISAINNLFTTNKELSLIPTHFYQNLKFIMNTAKIYGTRQAPEKKRPTLEEQQQICQLCKKSYPETTFPPCDGDNLCQNCYQYLEKLEQGRKIPECKKHTFEFNRNCNDCKKEYRNFIFNPNTLQTFGSTEKVK